MAEKTGVDRTKVTFSEAEGLEPLPQPLALGELSKEVRGLLWRLFHEDFDRHTSRPSIGGYPRLNEPWDHILYDFHTDVLFLPADEFSARADVQSETVKSILLKGRWNKTFDFITFVLRHRKRPYQFERGVASALRRGRAAYVLVDEGRTIAPAVSPEEGVAIQKAFRELDQAGLAGGRACLRAASDALNKGDFPSSVRESVHAVESVARVLDAGAAKTLAPALKALGDKVKIHRALEQGFGKIYGYSNDEQGIRHPILDLPADVDQSDAVFMIGACASFITYLIGKARTAGLLKR